jgi:hypothetical protein
MKFLKEGLMQSAAKSIAALKKYGVTKRQYRALTKKKFWPMATLRTEVAALCRDARELRVLRALQDMGVPLSIEQAMALRNNDKVQCGSVHVYKNLFW